MAARRQSAWAAQLKEKAFLSATIKPIADDTVTFKPPIPYALREVKRSMDNGIHFRNNTYGVGGIAGDAHVTALHEYGDWDPWAQLPAGNVAERNEGLSNNAKSLPVELLRNKHAITKRLPILSTSRRGILYFIHMKLRHTDWSLRNFY